MWPGYGLPLPPELVETRDWLFEVFKEAGRGLPLPQQIGLLLIAQAITAGMFATWIVPSWLQRDAQRLPDGLEPLLVILPAPLQTAVRQLGTPALDELERALSALGLAIGSSG
ncbi:MAG TPA: hypothetical protein V6D47_17020 [Oscillatoriaceae cyanobacterium]